MEEDKRTDEELIQRLRQGDKDAEWALYDRYITPGTGSGPHLLSGRCRP